MWTQQYFDIRKAWKEHESSTSIESTTYPCAYADDTTGKIGVVGSTAYVNTFSLFVPARWELDTTYLTSAMEKTNYSKPKIFFALGSGTTSPSLSDYKLENQVITLTPTVTREIKFENGKLNITYSMILENNTEEEITVSEIGLYFPAGLSQYRYCYPILVERSVFAPITIPAGGIGKLQWKYNEPCVS